MVADNEASKKGTRSPDTNNVEEGTRRTFIPEPTPTTRAMNKSFDDAFRKVDDAGCATAVGPKREAEQGLYPRACSTTVAGGIPWPRPPAPKGAGHQKVVAQPWPWPAAASRTQEPPKSPDLVAAWGGPATHRPATAQDSPATE